MTGGFARRCDLSGGVTPTINVTPLVDVVLVLLIIFMVVAPQLEKDIALDLPQIFNPDPDAKIAEPFKVSIPEAGEYYLDDEAYDLDRLIEHLSAERAIDPMRRLVVRADAGLKYKDVREFQNRVQEAGFPGMSFVVNQKHREGGSVMVSAKESAAAPGTTNDEGAAASASGMSESSMSSSGAGPEAAAGAMPGPGAAPAAGEN
ncbi:biopolymer transporter ExbD [Candidatus Binatia bacterium]|nr:biopolymer transporter ExbD [Candidatus Binatia bacterium]